jgi:hypothetical protein
MIEMAIVLDILGVVDVSLGQYATLIGLTVLFGFVRQLIKLGLE